MARHGCAPRKHNHPQIRGNLAERGCDSYPRATTFPSQSPRRNIQEIVIRRIRLLTMVGPMRQKLQSVHQQGSSHLYVGRGLQGDSSHSRLLHNDADKSSQLDALQELFPCDGYPRHSRVPLHD